MGSERLGDDLAAKQQELITDVAKLQSTRSIQKHYISINEQLIARKGNEENNFIYNSIKNKILRNKCNKRSARLVHRKLQNIIR